MYGFTPPTTRAAADMLHSTLDVLAALPWYRAVQVVFAVCLIDLFVTVVYRLWVYPFFTSPLRHLPGPKDNFLIFGQTRTFLRSPWIGNVYHQWALRWPETPFIRFLGVGNAEALLATSINAYREVLQTKCSSFVKPELTRLVAGVVVGEGLPFAEGNAHRLRKAALMPVFSIAQTKAFLPTAQAKASQLADVLASQRSALGHVEVETDIWKTALDMIGIKVLGVDLDHLGSPNSPLFGFFAKTTKFSPIAHVLHYLSAYFPLRKYLPFDTKNEFMRNYREMREFLHRKMDSRRQEVKAKSQDEPRKPDAMQLMLDQDGLWDDESRVEYLVNLLMLGHDTTACTLVWAVDLLARHPLYQERLRAEVLSMMSHGSRLSYAQVEQLRFLDNFLHEVLRVFCPVSFIPREAAVDTIIDGVALPRGTLVHLSPATVNLSPAIWGPDAEVFDPDRWDRLEGDASSAYAFATFHNGPRVCIGKQLSMMEMKVCLIELVARFRVEPVGAVKPVEFASPSFTLRPKERLRVKLVDL